MSWKSCKRQIEAATDAFGQLLADVCVLRVMGTAGKNYTILVPDDELRRELSDLINSEDDEVYDKALITLQSLILCDGPIANLEQLAKSRAPTAAGFGFCGGDKIDKSSMKLKDSRAVVTESKIPSIKSSDFTVSFFTISSGYPSRTEGEGVVGASYTGGADLGDTVDRENIFNVVFKKAVEGNRDVAMELLLEIAFYAKNELQNQDLLDLIVSQISYDSVASLFILLRPYSDNAGLYLDNGFLKGFLEYLYGSDDTLKDTFKSDPDRFGYSTDLDGDLEGLRKLFSHDVSNFANRLAANAGTGSNQATFRELGKIILETKHLPSKRQSVSQEVRIAEAEARVVFAHMQSGRADAADIEIIKSFTLDAPYMVDKKTMDDSNTAVYFSIPHLINRSDAMLFMPGIGGVTLSQLDSKDIISIDETFRAQNKELRKASSNANQATAAIFVARYGAK